MTHKVKNSDVRGGSPTTLALLAIAAMILFGTVFASQVVVIINNINAFGSYQPELSWMVNRIKRNPSEQELFDLIPHLNAGYPMEMAQASAPIDLDTIHQAMTADEWLWFMGSFKNNVFPIKDVIRSLPESAQLAAVRCGAQYAQVLRGGEKTNILCLYVVDDDLSAEFIQTSMSNYFYDGSYYRTTFHPAVFNTGRGLIVFGLPDSDNTPYPFELPQEWQGVKVDYGIMEYIVPDAPTLSEEIAKAFSIASGTNVSAQQIQRVYVEPSPNDSYSPNDPDAFVAQIEGIWFYYSHTRQNEDDESFQYYFGKLFDKGACITVAPIQFGQPTQMRVCRSLTPKHAAS